MRPRPAVALAAALIAGAALSVTAAPRQSARPLLMVSPVVSNVDATLTATDQVDDSEPSIAVNPKNPNQIAMFTGRDRLDSGENWLPGGCQPHPETCPQGAGNDKGSIWLSDDGGRTWSKQYVVPRPTGLNVGVCVCDRVLSWSPDGWLTATFLVFDWAIYTATTNNPWDANAWRYRVDATGRALPVARSDRAYSGLSPFDFLDQPQSVIAPDPLNPGTQNVYVSYSDDPGPYDPLYSTYVAVAAGAESPAFTRKKMISQFPVCCDDQPSHVDVNTFFESVKTLRLAADRKTGTVWALWGLPLGGTIRDYRGAHDQYAGLQQEYVARVEQRVVRSTDGGRTWSLNGTRAGIVVDTAYSAEMAAKFANFSGLFGGNHSLAVDERDGSLYVAYGEYDQATNNNRLAIRRVTADAAGKTTIGPKHHLTGHVDGALPALAVTDDGTVGALYYTYAGEQRNGFAVVSAHLSRSYDGGATWDDTVLGTFASAERENTYFKQRPLGDYQPLVAVGNTFYGVTTVNGRAFGRDVDDWDPLFVRMPSTDRAAGEARK